MTETPEQKPKTEAEKAEETRLLRELVPEMSRIQEHPTPEGTETAETVVEPKETLE